MRYVGDSRSFLNEYSTPLATDRTKLPIALTKIAAVTKKLGLFKVQWYAASLVSPPRLTPLDRETHERPLDIFASSRFELFPEEVCGVDRGSKQETL